MKNTAIALFIILLLVSFEWIKTDYELKETKKDRGEWRRIAKALDSVNTTNIENNRILMNRIEYYTKKQRQ